MVADHNVDGVIIGHPGGDILYANSAACEMFRTTEDELRRLGRPGITAPDDPLWLAMTEERRRTGRVRGVARMYRSDGTTFLADVASSIFQLHDGDERSCVLLRDVTDQVLQDRSLTAYNEVVQSLLAGSDLHAVLQIVAHHARIVFDATDATVVTTAEPPEDVVVIAADGPHASEHLGRSYPAGSLLRQVIESREPLLIEKLEEVPPFPDGRRVGRGSAVVAPILTGDDVFGVLFVGAPREGRAYQAEEVERVALYARRSALVIAIAESRAATEREQRRLNQQLQQALRSRIIIEQAKGVISAVRHVTPEEGFQRLRAYARSHNQDVHSVARAVIEQRLMI